jgi:hypothetical protein
MTHEDLDRIERTMVPLAVGEHLSARAKSIASQFNVQVDAARARIAAAREAAARAGSISSAELNELRAYAVMYAEERERLVRQWGISPARST